MTGNFVLCQNYPLLIINFKELVCGHNKAEGVPDLGQMALVFFTCTRVPAPSVGSVGQGPGQGGQGRYWSPLQALVSPLESRRVWRNNFKGLSQLFFWCDFEQAGNHFYSPMKLPQLTWRGHLGDCCGLGGGPGKKRPRSDPSLEWLCTDSAGPVGGARAPLSRVLAAPGAFLLAGLFYFPNRTKNSWISHVEWRYPGGIHPLEEMGSEGMKGWISGWFSLPGHLQLRPRWEDSSFSGFPDPAVTGQEGRMSQAGPEIAC